jgi:hypothetical protein
LAFTFLEGRQPDSYWVPKILLHDKSFNTSPVFRIPREDRTRKTENDRKQENRSEATPIPLNISSNPGVGKCFIGSQMGTASLRALQQVSVIKNILYNIYNIRIIYYVYNIYA